MQVSPAVRKSLLLGAEVLLACRVGSPCSFGANEPDGDAFVLKVEMIERMEPRHLPVCGMAFTVRAADRQQAANRSRLSCPLPAHSENEGARLWDQMKGYCLLFPTMCPAGVQLCYDNEQRHSREKGRKEGQGHRQDEKDIAQAVLVVESRRVREEAAPPKRIYSEVCCCSCCRGFELQRRTPTTCSKAGK